MKRSSILSTFLLLIIMLCLGTILVVGALFVLPERVELAYGPAAEGFNLLEHSCLSARLLLQAEVLKKPQDLLGSERLFEIQPGESTWDITNRLQSEGLIPNAAALRDYLLYAGLDTNLQAGEYTLSARMTPLDIAHALQDATPSEVTFYILPGWRTEEIAAALPTSGLSIPPEIFLSNAKNPPPVSSLIKELPPGASLEGFLFPGSYILPRQIAVDGFIRILLEAFQVNVTSEILEGIQRQGLDLFQAVSLASIIEREAVVEAEMPLIASVFLNRLSIGIKLDADPTVQYSLGYNTAQGTWWTNPLSLEDLQFDSPYNTYIYEGLPPGPIAHPGMDALRAVAFPAQTPYYYFRAACDGSGRHTFAETFEEHQANACPTNE